MATAVAHPGASRFLPPLQSASALFSRIDRLASLDGVVEITSSYLDYTQSWTLESASIRVLPHLFYRLARWAESAVYVEAKCDAFYAFAAADDKLSEMQTLDKYFPDLVINEAAKVAASAGHTDILRWLYKRGSLVCWRPDIVELAAGSGVLTAVQFLDRRFPSREAGKYIAALRRSRSSKVTRFFWKHLMRMDFDRFVVGGIASAAPLALARWMVRVSRPLALVLSVDVAVQHGNLALLKWVNDHDATATTAAMDYAATFGYLDILKWLHRNRREGCTSAAMDGAAGHGHFPVVVWLHNHRSEGCTSQAFFLAAIKGHLRICTWLFLHRSEGFPPSTFDHVCGNGQLLTAQWLHAGRLGGGSINAMDWAAAQNHLDVVQWLHEARTEGCSVLAMNSAACHGHLNVVRWLSRNRPEGCTTDAIDHASGNGHVHVIRWLIDNRGLQFTPAAMDNAAGGGHLSLLRWLGSHPRSPGCSSSAMDNAASRGHREVVEWLHHARREGGTSRGVDASATRGDLAMLEFFRLNRPEHVSSYAFRVCAARGDLYTAKWIATYYEQAVDPRVLREYAPVNGWSAAVLDAAFHLLT